VSVCICRSPEKIISGKVTPWEMVYKITEEQICLRMGTLLYTGFAAIAKISRNKHFGQSLLSKNECKIAAQAKWIPCAKIV
jgi:hypothetical protein